MVGATMDTTRRFLEKILPRKGIYFVAVPLLKPKQGFRHIPCHGIDAILSAVSGLNAQPTLTVYYACDSYRHEYIEAQDPVTGKLKKRRRVKDNVLYVKAFWLDIDCGESKAYPT